VRRQLARAKEWTADTELLAKIFEEISILAAEHRRKKPVQIPRPDHLRPRARRKSVRAGEPNPEGIKHAIGVLTANAHPGGRR
jgi:hypothetical protein